MRTLRRKLLRELNQMKGQVASIALVVTSGVAVMVSMGGALAALEGATRDFYRYSRFADLFITVVRAPEPLVQQVRELDGVAFADSRVVVDARLVFDESGVPASGHFVSLPEGGPGALTLNRPFLRNGRWPERAISGSAREVLVSEQFAQARELTEGDTIHAVIEGRLVPFRISGTAVSAEYVYVARPGDLLPDDRRYGVFWTSRDELAAAVDMTGAFNDLAITLAPDAYLPDLRTRLDSLLAPYGSRGAVPREDQFSYQLLQTEIDELRVSSVVMPALFLGVAAFLLGVVLSRLIGTQRGVIAVLKAFGYSDGQVAAHYRWFAILIVGLGSIVGILAGWYMGDLLVGIYEEFFRIPDLEYRFEPRLVALAIGVSLLAATWGSRRAVRTAASLPPAAAMRPEPPASYKPTPLERIGLGRLLTPRGRMILREIGRRPARTGFSVIAIAFSMAILVMSGALMDGVTALMQVQFTRVQREDLSVSFDRGLPLRVRHELAAIPGVQRVELTRTAPARLIADHRDKQVAVEGRLPGTELRRLLGADERQVPLPPEGLLLTRWLAEALHVSAGAEVTVQFLEDERRFVPVRVAGITDEPIGGGAVMDFQALASLLDEQGTATGALLAVDGDVAPVIARLEEAPRVTAVAERAEFMRRFRDEYTRLLLQTAVLLAAFSAVIAVGVVYNGARIALAERARDLGVLRVLGFRRREVSTLLLAEIGVQLVLAIPVGAVLGYGFAGLIARAISAETFRVPAVVSNVTLIASATVVLVSGLASAWLVRRRLNRLDMVQVLKAPE